MNEHEYTQKIRKVTSDNIVKNPILPNRRRRTEEGENFINYEVLSFEMLILANINRIQRRVNEIKCDGIMFAVIKTSTLLQRERAC